MKIHLAHYEKAYALGRQVIAGKLRPKDAKAELAEMGVNANSAADLLYILRHMLKGERYTRAMSTANTDDYLTWIRRDYGDEVYTGAVGALGKHIEYYTGLKGDRLESHRKVLAKHLALVPKASDTFGSPEELPADIAYPEGSVRQVLVNTYERNPAARQACLAHYGHRCAVCNFDFGRTYGSIGKDFIHVHHLKEIASIAKEYQVDPIQDLRPVCPNCHAMLHRRKPAFSIGDLKQVLSAQPLAAKATPAAPASFPPE